MRDLLESYRDGILYTYKKPARKLQPFAPVVNLTIFVIKMVKAMNLNVDQRECFHCK